MTEVPTVVVDLSDDDDSCTFVECTPRDIENCEKEKLPRSFESIETIVLDEERTPKKKHDSQSEDEVIEISDTPSNIQEIIGKAATAKSIEVPNDNDKLFSIFIKQCLEIEDSTGMRSVVEKTLRPIYNDTDHEFLASSHFKTVIRKTINNLQSDPGKRFTYINYVCGILKQNKKKKRIKPITLHSEITNGRSGPKTKSCFAKDNYSTKDAKKRKNNSDNHKHKKQKVTAIDVNNTAKIISRFDNNKQEVAVINVDETTKSRSNFGNKKHQSQKQPVTDVNENDEKIIYNVDDENDVIILNDEKENQSSQSSNKDDYLVPKVVEVYSDEYTTNDIKIKEMEDKIKVFKNRIQALEEREVINDNCKSPYLLCDRYKSKIVQLYKEICKMTGAELAKRREIRLQVADHHPAGPARCLENFINNNIGSDGDPPFPDFCDVIACVLEANINDNLGWNKAQIVNEANALFTQCGRALQKRRQKREWQDMLGKVKLETCDDDPAEKDPILMAKLEENRELAVKKEADILEKYTSLQAEMSANRSKTQTTSNISQMVSFQGDNCESGPESVENFVKTDSKSKEGYSDTKTDKHKKNVGKEKNELERGVPVNITNTDKEVPESTEVMPEVSNNTGDYNTIDVMSETEESMKNKGLNGIKIVKTEHISSLDFIRKIDSSNMSNISIKFEEDIKMETSVSDSDANSLHNIECVVEKVNCVTADNVGKIDSSNISNVSIKFEEDIKMETGVSDSDANSLNNIETVVEKVNCVTADNVVSNSQDCHLISAVNIKKEPGIDIIKLLEAIGDNYTTTIIDIEDPFLIIEISDSSSEDED